MTAPPWMNNVKSEASPEVVRSAVALFPALVREGWHLVVVHQYNTHADDWLERFKPESLEEAGRELWNLPFIETRMAVVA